GRIPQYVTATANQDGNVGDLNFEMIEQALDVRVAIDVEVRVRIAIAAEKRLEPKRAGRVLRPRQNHVARKIRHQVGPSKDECAKKQLAQLGISLDQMLQCGAIEFDQLARR